MSCNALIKYAQQLLLEANGKDKEIDDYLIKKLNVIMNTSWMKFTKFRSIHDGKLVIEVEYPYDKLVYSRTKDIKMLIELSLNTFDFKKSGNRIPKAIFKVKISEDFNHNKMTFLHGKKSQAKNAFRLTDEALLEMENYTQSYKDKLPEIISNIYQLKTKMLAYPILEIQHTCLYLIALGKFHHFLQKNICILIAKIIWQDRYN